MRTFISALALTAAMGLAAPAQAWDAGDWLIRAGASDIVPKSDNGTVAPGVKLDVQDQWGVTFNFTYMYTANWGVEVLAAIPYEHDIDATGLGTVAKVKHLPPTVSLQYHFMPDSAFQPYLGAGVNYTYFFDEKTKGALSGSSIKVDSSSFGFAAQAGFDYVLSDAWFVNFDARWVGIETKASIDGGSKIKIKIDPMVYGIHLGYKF